MLDFNDGAIEAYEIAMADGVITDADETIDQLIDIILEQEIVTIANENGSVSFDFTDLIEV
jgi:hypothetical protein